MTSVLHSPAEAFDEQDDFLYLVLGLISVARRMAERIEAEAVPDPSDEAKSQEPIARILI
jgi:hypothetical protein